MDYKVKDNALIIELDERASAQLIFHVEGDRLYLDSTYTPQAYRGRGVGGRLMLAAVDYASKKRLRIVPVCGFSVAYFSRHAEYADHLWKG